MTRAWGSLGGSWVGGVVLAWVAACAPEPSGFQDATPGGPGEVGPGLGDDATAEASDAGTPAIAPEVTLAEAGVEVDEVATAPWPETAETEHATETTPTADDGDGDGIPDRADPFPTDPARPGSAAAFTVYGHTFDALYTLGAKTFDLSLVGAFRWPEKVADTRMTDIAIDAYGVLYGVTFNDLVVCHPQTAECWWLGRLGDAFNGLTLVPGSALGEDHDVLVGVTVDGSWWRLTLVPDPVKPTVTVTAFGGFGGAWQSAGDVFSIAGVGTFAAVYTSDEAVNRLVRVDPTSGQVTSVVGTIGDRESVYGLAGWARTAYAFDHGGYILKLDLATGAVLQTKVTAQAWAGAGVRTVLDPD